MSMTPQTLFHVELIVDSKLLLCARHPEPPQSSVIEHWTEADFKKEASRFDRVESSRRQLERESIRPAIACILNCEGLNELLEQCGDTAIIRISLEKPTNAPENGKSKSSAAAG